MERVKIMAVAGNGPSYAGAAEGRGGLIEFLQAPMGYGVNTDFHRWGDLWIWCDIVYCLLTACQYVLASGGRSTWPRPLVAGRKSLADCGWGFGGGGGSLNLRENTGNLPGPAVPATELLLLFWPRPMVAGPIRQGTRATMKNPCSIGETGVGIKQGRILRELR
jgi:hypothetical protein